MKPKVSCLCPTWGRITTIGECVDAFLRQTYVPRELLIMNDAPVRILNLAGVKADHVATLDGGGGHWRVAPGVDILIMNNPQPFETLGHKYNALLELATGAIIAHWEDDDLWFPHHLDFNVHRLLANPDAYCTKNDMAFVLTKNGDTWRYSGYSCNVFESQMVLWRALARKIQYSASHLRQSLTLYDTLKNNGFLDHRQDRDWMTYVFRWDTSFLHGELIDVGGRTIENWRETNKDFGETLTVRSCLPYLQMVLRECDRPPANPLLTPEQAKRAREWHTPTLKADAPTAVSPSPLLSPPPGRPKPSVPSAPPRPGASPPMRRLVPHHLRRKMGRRPGAIRNTAGTEAKRDARTIIILNRRAPYRAKETELIVKALTDAKYHVEIGDGHATLDGHIRMIESKRPRPLAVLRWEEHGRLFRTKSWEDFLLFCQSHAVAPLYVDHGYFDRGNHLLFDLYQPPSQDTIREDWGDLPTTVDWTAASPSVRAYRDKVLAEHTTALATEPMVKPPYAVIWTQQQANLLRNPLWMPRPDHWLESAVKAIRAMNLTPVLRVSPFHKDMPLPKDVQTFGGAKVYDDAMNARLTAHAAGNLIICSSVSNELTLLDKPVAALGTSWFNGLDVFAELQTWDDMALLTRKPNMDARARWTNWWLRRQWHYRDIVAGVEAQLRRFREGMNATPRVTDEAPLYVTFWTDDGYYAEQAKPLLDSFRQFGLEYVTYEMPNTGDWKRNTFLKPGICRRALLEHKGRTIVFLDSDAQVMADPVLFKTLAAKADCGAYFSPGPGKLQSGTLWFNRTSAALRLIDDWERRQMTALRGDQDALGMAVADGKNYGLRVENLPPAYCRMNELMPHVEAVIAHRFAHREGKAAVLK